MSLVAATGWIGAPLWGTTIRGVTAETVENSPHTTSSLVDFVITAVAINAQSAEAALVFGSCIDVPKGDTLLTKVVVLETESELPASAVPTAPKNTALTKTDVPVVPESEFGQRKDDQTRIPYPGSRHGP